MQGDGRRLVVLFAVVPNPTVLRRHPQHPASAAPGSAPCRTSALTSSSGFCGSWALRAAARGRCTAGQQLRSNVSDHKRVMVARSLPTNLP
jgi:hypothetical protein